MKNDETWIENHELCIKNDEICIKNDECFKNLWKEPGQELMRFDAFFT